ncbi:MAG TPA: hypothetical protein HA257_01310 [Candidatus Methanoperedenaceae archaeon]|nr:hypothetical protein [Candidatus Methanoperedenaceae archaeon]
MEIGKFATKRFALLPAMAAIMILAVSLSQVPRYEYLLYFVAVAIWILISRRQA